MDETERFDEIESIDEAADILGWTEERQVGVEYEIDPETEFWGHCSNLQAWYEHNYDTRLLHSNLSFPLLKRLAEVGDPIANRVFKEEIVKRFESGYPTVIKYIIKEKLLEYLNREELRLIIDQGFFETYENYLDHDEGFFDKFRLLEKAGLRKLVFLHKSSLDLNYIPDKLLCRDDTITNLIFNFRRILEESEQPSINCLILGKSGVGKTAIARFFGRNFRKIADEKGKEIIVEYYNCINFRSKSKIIRELLAKYTHGSGRGFSDEEALKMILKQLIGENRYLLLIIDEVHLLSPDDILGFLAISETFGHQNAKISIILISLLKEWMTVETTPILSKINSTFTLEPYSLFIDIKSILKYRIDLAFKDYVVDDDILTMISQVVLDYQDMRHGVEILRRSGIYADNEGKTKITADLVRQASNDVYPSFRGEIVDQLKDQELLTLFGIVRSLINQNESYTLVDNAFEEYQIMCETYSIIPHIKKTFRKYIQTLSKLRIISSRMVRIEEAERGRHLEISLIDIMPERLEDFLIEIFNKKFDS
jgi:cell division control protein 6